MTVGEKIQMYRKKLGLSQEELGQKLLVSRQTISQWETDQTIPSIDNLIRLKEIFCVSIDDLLNPEIKEPDSDIEPMEAYAFEFSITELDGIFRMQKKKLYKRLIITVLLCFFAIIPCVASTISEILLGILAGAFMVNLFIFIRKLRGYNKFTKEVIPLIASSIYEYWLYKDFININIYRNNEKTRQLKCYYNDIEGVQQYNNWLFFQVAGQSYIVRKSDLKENSAFYSCMLKKSEKPTNRQIPGKLRTASIILFVASLFSPVIAMNLITLVSERNGLFIENIWIMFLMTPITIASVVLGFVLNSKGYKYKKNVIAGIIMTVILCIYGSFSFVFGSMYDHSDTPVVETEQIIGIDIPEYTSISTEDMSKWGQRPSGEHTLYKSEISFNNSQVEEFEKEIQNDEIWLSIIPNDLIGVMSRYREFTTYDYALIYNTDTAKFNALPENEGTYHFINILYSSELNKMYILEYDIDYVK